VMTVQFEFFWNFLLMKKKSVMSLVVNKYVFFKKDKFLVY
jgi:hypothetical protein